MCRMSLIRSLSLLTDCYQTPHPRWGGGGLTWVGGDKIVYVSKILSDYSHTSLSYI